MILTLTKVNSKVNLTMYIIYEYWAASGNNELQAPELMPVITTQMGVKDDRNQKFN